MKSTYTYQIIEAQGRNVISITDLDAGRTVTNNIENVLAEIAKAEKIHVEDYMIVYRDTALIWDGYDAKAHTFIPLQKKTEDEAIRRYIERQLNIPPKEMEWESKVKLVQLGNKKDASEADKKEFQDYAIAQIENFDAQAWDMFCNLVDIMPSEMETDKPFWEKVYAKIKDVDCNDTRFGLRSGMRISLIQTICKDHLKL